MVVQAEELGPSTGVSLTSEGADSIVRLFRRIGVWLTPTLSTFEAVANTWGNPTRLAAYIAEGTAANLRSSTLRQWRRNNHHTQSGTALDRLAAYTEITCRLHAAAVSILAGTDGPGMQGVIPGSRSTRSCASCNRSA